MSSESSSPFPPHDAPPISVLRWSGLTDRGRVRANNEDSFLALTFDSREVRFLGKTGQDSLAKADFVFAVSDGMGGEKSGEFASRIAVDKITRLLPKSFGLSAKGISAGHQDVLTELFNAVHRDLSRMSEVYEECRGMGATLTLVWFTPGWVHWAHVGDSRLYYLPKAGGLTQVSKDDSFVGFLRRSGQINEREARSHPRKNALNKALGAGHMFVDPQVGAVGYEPGDKFLLVTDGVTDGLWDRHLEEILREPDAVITPAQQLLNRALENSGRDNTTAVVIEVIS